MEMRFGDETLYPGPRGFGTTIRTIEDELAFHSLALAAIDVLPLEDAMKDWLGLINPKKT